MTEIVTYRQVSFDTAHLAPGQPARAKFFDVPRWPLLDGSTPVTDYAEKLIVHWLMLSPPARELILSELRLPIDTRHFPEVVQPFYAPGERDLDLIFCPPLSPQFAFALECKRVKVETVNDRRDRINKLRGVAGGVRQANELHTGKYAFHQTWLAILTEVAAAGQHDHNIPTRGIRPESTPESGDTSRTTFRQLIEFPGREKLHKEVGILHVEIVQPSRLSIDTQATIRASVYRRAVPREQRSSVTNRMMEIMGNRGQSGTGPQ